MASSDALGTLRLLEAIRTLGLDRQSRFYRASTSDSDGRSRSCRIQLFYPRCPYGAAKVYAHRIRVNDREA
jgi:GDPmannose 4,6-dehydratase